MQVFLITDNDLTQVSFSYDNMGVGTDDPSESLYLTGEIVLGEAVSSARCNTVFRWSVLVRMASFWHPITDSSVAIRSFDQQSISELMAASVLYSNESVLKGENNLLNRLNYRILRGIVRIFLILLSRILNLIRVISYANYLLGITHQSSLGHIEYSTVFSDQSLVTFMRDS